jgi:hypothetical protein
MKGPRLVFASLAAVVPLGGVVGLWAAGSATPDVPHHGAWSRDGESNPGPIHYERTTLARLESGLAAR